MTNTMEKWEKEFEKSTRIRMAGFLIGLIKAMTINDKKMMQGLVDAFIQGNTALFHSLLAKTRKEERLRIEKEIVGRMPMFVPKKTREIMKVFLDIIKPVFSLSSEQEAL